jgi:hypothetical protein
MTATRFLSEEDLDLRTLSDDEFDRLAAAAFRQLQESPADDQHWYRHGCIAIEPGFEAELPRFRTSPL